MCLPCVHDVLPIQLRLAPVPTRPCRPSFPWWRRSGRDKLTNVLPTTDNPTPVLQITIPGIPVRGCSPGRGWQGLCCGMAVQGGVHEAANGPPSRVPRLALLAARGADPLPCARPAAAPTGAANSPGAGPLLRCLPHQPAVCGALTLLAAPLASRPACSPTWCPR